MDNKKVDLFYDLIDKACMIYYYDLKLDYLEAFIKVSQSITDEFDESRLSQTSITKLNKIYSEISKNEFLNEEVRLAVELILIKGFKHRNLLLDFITPEAINYLFSFIVNSIINSDEEYKKSGKVRIMDTVLGTGNLLQTIINNSPVDMSAVGIEKDELLVALANEVSNLLDNELIINYQDATLPHNSLVDFCIGDFGESEDIYDIILERLHNLDNGYFIYLINNDFFSNASVDFRTQLTKDSTLVGLIVLPNSFVSENHIGKSILIGKKEQLDNYKMGIVQLDDDFSLERLQVSLEKIERLIKNIKN